MVFPISITKQLDSRCLFNKRVQTPSNHALWWPAHDTRQDQVIIEIVLNEETSKAPNINLTPAPLYPYDTKSNGINDRWLWHAKPI